MSNFDLVATLKANVSDFTRGMKDARDQINDLSKNSEKLEKMGKSFSNVGKKMTAGLTLPLVGLATMAVRTGMEYETSMSAVQAISGATGDEMEKLETVAREMGATTRYSASEAADGLSYMALAGWDVEQMTSALPGVLNLATAGQLDLASASDILTDMMSMFGIEAEDASKATDIFASAQSNSNTNVEQLSEALKMAGPAASSMSQSLEDTSAVLGILADNGIKGSSAGTALNSMFMDLQKSAEDGAVSIGDTSVAVYDAEGNMRSIVDIIKDVEGATAGMSDEQKNSALQAVFQQRSLRGMNTLLNEGTDSLFDLQGELYNSSGAAQNMAEVMDDNMQGSLLNLKSAVEEIAIQFFELGDGPLRSLIDWLTETVRKFGELDEGTKQTIIIIGGILAAIGPLLMILGLLITSAGKVAGVISTMSKFLFGAGESVGFLAKAFAFLTSPIGLVVIAIIGLIAFLVYLWNTNEEFRAAVIEIWNSLKDNIIQAWETLKGYLEIAVQAITEFIRTAFENLKTWWSENQEAILETGRRIWEKLSEYVSIAITAVTEFVREIFGGLVEWWKENNEMILQAAQNVWNVVSNVIKVALGVIMAVMQKVWPFVEKLVVFTWNAIKDVIQGAIKVITGIIEFFSALFTGNWSALWESIKSIVTGAVQLIWGLVKLWFVGKIIALGKALLVGLKTIVTTIWTAIKSIFTGGLQFIFGKVSSVFSSISGIIKTIMGSIRGTVSSILNAIKTVFSNILSGIVRSVSGGFSKVTSAFSKGMSSALKIVTNFVSKFFKAGANIVGNIAKGITSAVGKVTSAIGGVLGKARDLLPFSPPKDKSSPMVDVHKNGIIEQIAKGVYGEENQLKKAMNSVLGTAGNEVSDFNGNINDALRSSINGGYSMNASGELSVKQQPAYLNLNIGGQNFTAFVENIQSESDRQLHLNMI